MFQHHRQIWGKRGSVSKTKKTAMKTIPIIRLDRYYEKYGTPHAEIVYEIKHMLKENSNTSFYDGVLFVRDLGRYIRYVWTQDLKEIDRLDRHSEWEKISYE